MRYGRVLGECAWLHGGVPERAGGAAARGTRGAPAGALLPQNAWQGGRARAAAEKRTAGGACGSFKELRQRLRERWARRRGSDRRSCARQREEQPRRRRGAAVSSAGHQAMAGASMDTCRCRSKHTTLSRSGAAARHVATSIARTAVRTASSWRSRCAPTGG